MTPLRTFAYRAILVSSFLIAYVTALFLILSEPSTTSVIASALIGVALGGLGSRLAAIVLERVSERPNVN